MQAKRAQQASLRQRLNNGFHSRPALLIAFAFAVMADPISSVAYAIEAALRSLHGDLGLLLPTMGIVVGVLALVITNYHQMIGRFPEGGGAAAAAGLAFGESWAFVPIGALIVDFVLTIAISVSAASSAIIAYLPTLANFRLLLALGVLLAVAALSWFGHISRAIFASMAIGFIAIVVVVLIGGADAHVPLPQINVSGTTNQIALIAILLAFPVAMALATGVEITSSAIAQLGQLNNAERRLFGRLTLWLTLAIAGTLTLGLTAIAVKLHLGIPHHNSTLIADIAKTSVGGQLFATFQFIITLLLFAAASSAFQAGPGLLKALARRTHPAGHKTGILHSHFGATNSHHTPYWALVLFFVVSAIVVTAANALEQKLVLYYAVAVFMSFFVGLLAMARLALQDKRWVTFMVSSLGVITVGFTLLINLRRGDPIVSIISALLIALFLYVLWVRGGRTRGIAQAVIESESDL